MVAYDRTMMNLNFTFNYDGGDEEARAVLAAANAYRAQMVAPYQSLFRVLCVLVYADDKKRVHYVVGANAEPCCLSGSICAERAAIVQLRGKEPWSILRLYIVSDSTSPITPGVLCREFLSSVADDELLIIMGDAHTNRVLQMRLGEIYPHACIYRHIGRADLERFAKKLASQGLQHASAVSKEAGKIYELALHATDRDKLDAHHPLRYGAAVLFSDSTTAVGWQKKALEYGCTLGAVTQLAQAIENKALTSIRPLMLVQVDQYGIAHAPFAAGRAYLTEHAHGNTVVLLHNSGGKLLQVLAKDLAPYAPAIWPSVDGASIRSE